LVGFIAGILNIFIGATGPFQAPFYLRNDLSKEEIVATKASSQMVGHLLKIPAFIKLGFDYKNYFILIIALSLAAIVGTKIGVSLLGKINESIFIKLYKSVLFIAAIRILYKIIFN